MPSRKFLHVALIETLGLFQGLSIVIVPAASTLITSSNYQGLSPSEYGSLYLPEIIAAILLSSLGGAYAKTHGIRPLLLLGILGNFFGMLLLGSTNAFFGIHSVDYALLLASLLFIGIGFGSTLTSLNTLMIQLFPEKPATAITALHSSLGIGTALSPLLLDLGLKWENWWIAPVIIGAGFFILFFCFEFIKPFYQKTSQQIEKQETKNNFPVSLWLFIIAIFLYGFCETVIGNWSPIYLHQIKNISISSANTALASFWALVTIGRIGISILSNWISFRIFYFALPILLIVTFFVIPHIEGSLENILIFAIAGLGCSALFPLNVSFGQQSFVTIQSIVSGALMAAYMLGYGLASYGIGELQNQKVLSINFIFYLGAILALIMAIFNWINLFVFKPNLHP